MNARTSTLRRTCCAVGAAATLGFALAAPASAVVEPGPGPGVTPTVVVIPVDDDALELMQLGGGILAGLALAGAGAALVSRRHHAAPRLA